MTFNKEGRFNQYHGYVTDPTKKTRSPSSFSADSTACSTVLTGTPKSVQKTRSPSCLSIDSTDLTAVSNSVQVKKDHLSVVQASMKTCSPSSFSADSTACSTVLTATPKSVQNTRSPSCLSIDSTDLTATSNSVQVKKDNTHCNKQIADLEKELRNITMERNQLLRRRNHPIHAATRENKENKEPEPAQQNLKREMNDILEGRALVEKTLHEKEAEIEKVTAEKKAVVERLELDINLLRESNNKLVEDIVRVEKERQLSEEKTEIELLQLKAQAEQDRTLLIKSYEDAIEAIRTDSAKKEEHIAQLVSKLSLTEESLQKQLAEKEHQLEEASMMHQDQLAKISSQHLEVVKSHHKVYEKVIADKVDQFNAEREQLSISLQQSLDYLRLEFQAVLAAAEAKETQLKAEVEKMSHTIQFKENEITHLGETLRSFEKETADEWIQRETSIMSQLTEQNQKSVEEFETRLQEIRAELHQAKDEIRRVVDERDAARDDAAVFQVQGEAQLAALSEQYDQERAMLIEKLSVQTREIEEINSAKIQDLQAQSIESQSAFEEFRRSTLRQMEQMEHDHEEAVLTAVRDALESVDNELESLRKDREAYLPQKEYADLQACMEPLRDQLEMYDAEKKALLNRALFAENSMASFASKYTQLLGHQNIKQKIHHLEKLKQEMFYLRKDLADKNLALEKEKKARQKADARVKELTGQKKYDPAEAFKVPENPAVISVVNKAPPKLSSGAEPTATPPPTTETKEIVRQQRKPLCPQVHGTGLFLAMDGVEKERADMERKKQQQQQLENRRKAAANFDAFDVDFGPSFSRPETFDVRASKQLNVVSTKQNNKENINRGPQRHF